MCDYTNPVMQDALNLLAFLNTLTSLAQMPVNNDNFIGSSNNSNRYHHTKEQIWRSLPKNRGSGFQYNRTNQTYKKKYVNKIESMSNLNYVTRTKNFQYYYNKKLELNNWSRTGTSGTNVKPFPNPEVAGTSRTNVKPFLKSDATGTSRTNVKPFLNSGAAGTSRTNVKFFPHLDVAGTSRTNVKPFPNPEVAGTSRTNVKPFLNSDATGTSRTNVKPFPQPDVVGTSGTNVKPFPNPEVAGTSRTNVKPFPNPEVAGTSRTNVKPFLNSDATGTSRTNVKPFPHPDVVGTSGTNVKPLPNPEVAGTSRTNVKPFLNSDATGTSRTNVKPFPHPDVVGTSGTNVKPSPNLYVACTPKYNFKLSTNPDSASRSVDSTLNDNSTDNKATKQNIYSQETVKTRINDIRRRHTIDAQENINIDYSLISIDSIDKTKTYLDSGSYSFLDDYKVMDMDLESPDESKNKPSTTKHSKSANETNSKSGKRPNKSTPESKKQSVINAKRRITMDSVEISESKRIPETSDDKTKTSEGLSTCLPRLNKDYTIPKLRKAQNFYTESGRPFLGSMHTLFNEEESIKRKSKLKTNDPTTTTKLAVGKIQIQNVKSHTFNTTNKGKSTVTLETPSASVKTTGKVTKDNKKGSNLRNKFKKMYYITTNVSKSKPSRECVQPKDESPQNTAVNPSPTNPNNPILSYKKQSDFKTSKSNSKDAKKASKPVNRESKNATRFDDSTTHTKNIFVTQPKSNRTTKGDSTNPENNKSKHFEDYKTARKAAQYQNSSKFKVKKNKIYKESATDNARFFDLPKCQIPGGSKKENVNSEKNKNYKESAAASASFDDPQKCQIPARSKEENVNADENDDRKKTVGKSEPPKRSLNGDSTPKKTLPEVLRVARDLRIKYKEKQKAKQLKTDSTLVELSPNLIKDDQSKRTKLSSEAEEQDCNLLKHITESQNTDNVVENEDDMSINKDSKNDCGNNKEKSKFLIVKILKNIGVPQQEDGKNIETTTATIPTIRTTCTTATVPIASTAATITTSSTTATITTTGATSESALPNDAMIIDDRKEIVTVAAATEISSVNHTEAVPGLNTLPALRNKGSRRPVVIHMAFKNEYQVYYGKTKPIFLPKMCKTVPTLIENCCTDRATVSETIKMDESTTFTEKCSKKIRGIDSDIPIIDLTEQYQDESNFYRILEENTDKIGEKITLYRSEETTNNQLDLQAMSASLSTSNLLETDNKRNLVKSENSIEDDASLCRNTPLEAANFSNTKENGGDNLEKTTSSNISVDENETNLCCKQNGEPMSTAILCSYILEANRNRVLTCNDNVLPAAVPLENPIASQENRSATPSSQSSPSLLETAMKQLSGKSKASWWINTPADEAAATRTVESEDSSETSSGINQGPRKINASIPQKEDNDRRKDTSLVHLLKDMVTNLQEPLTHKESRRSSFMNVGGEPTLVNEGGKPSLVHENSTNKNGATFYNKCKPPSNVVTQSRTPHAPVEVNGYTNKIDKSSCRIGAGQNLVSNKSQLRSVQKAATAVCSQQYSTARSTVYSNNFRSVTSQSLNAYGTNSEPIPEWVSCIANFMVLIVDCRMSIQTHNTWLKTQNVNEGIIRMETMIMEKIQEYRLSLYSHYLASLLASMDITDAMIKQPSKCLQFIYDFMKGTVSWVQIYLYLANLMSRMSKFYEKHPGLRGLYHWIKINVKAIEIKSLQLPRPGSFVFTSEQRNQLNEQVKFFNNLIMKGSAPPLNKNSKNIAANISPLSQNSVRSPDCRTIGTNVPLQNYRVPTQIPTSPPYNVDVPQPMTYLQNTIHTTVNHPAPHFNVQMFPSSDNSTENVRMSSTSLGVGPTLATELPVDATFKPSTPRQSHVTIILDEPSYPHVQTSSPSLNNLNQQIAARTPPVKRISANFNQCNVETASSQQAGVSVESTLNFPTSRYGYLNVNDNPPVANSSSLAQSPAVVNVPDSRTTPANETLPSLGNPNGHIYAPAPFERDYTLQSASPDPPSSSETRLSTNGKAATDIDESNEFHVNLVDLTWLDNYDSAQLKREVECIVKKEEDIDEDEVILNQEQFPVCYSPLDSGIEGSPYSQYEYSELVFVGRTCICKKPAEYICRCRMVMYCSNSCQIEDWNEHKIICSKKNTSLQT